MHERLRSHSQAAASEDLIPALASDPELGRYLPPERIRALMTDAGSHIGDAPGQCDIIVKRIEEVVS